MTGKIGRYLDSAHAFIVEEGAVAAKALCDRVTVMICLLKPAPEVDCRSCRRRLGLPDRETVASRITQTPSKA